MPKKPHPVEYHDAKVIAQAVRYDVALFLGRGRYAKASARSLAQAKKTANKLAKEHESRYRPLIYAVDAKGRSVFVAPELVKLAKSMAPEQPPAKARPKKPASPAKLKPRSTSKYRIIRSKEQIIADAKKGIMPDIPDFRAATHARYRGKLAQIVALVEKRDIDSLKAMSINPTSTSPKMMARYRELCLVALGAS